ncbi:zf-HC2 domain-containing protein [Streptomyces sp. KLOTTS4A1]|uniref:anti-sigma factor family protein n=1 Tax=Streptomyces sp. KLOTTS4A1 TaxID=3390996 RepID=UPI0039F49DBE
MSGSQLNPAERQLAEQHLGDRLAALVDGELGHDTRERVLAHLATCARCKAEADAQRRLKSVFAEVAPPPPSESFLARLQGLSDAGGPEDDRGGPFDRGDRAGPVDRGERTSAFARGGKGDPFGAPFGEGVFGVRGGGGLGLRPESFSYAPSGGRGGMLPGGDRAGGFRIHDVGRGGEARGSASRGRRFAFAAAGAVSLAAIALGGVSGMPVDSAEARGGANASPPRSQGAGAAAESNRRRGAGQSADAEAPGKLPKPVAATGVAAPEVVAPDQLPVTSPILNRPPALPPLIRPVGVQLPYAPLQPLAPGAQVPLAPGAEAPLAASSTPPFAASSAAPMLASSAPPFTASSPAPGLGEPPNPSPSAGLSLRGH